MNNQVVCRFLYEEKLYCVVIVGTYLIIPNVIVIINDSSTKTSSWINARPRYGNGGQVYQEHCKPYWQWRQYLLPSTLIYTNVNKPHLKR